MSEGLVRTWKDGPVGYLRLERPEKANAYNQELLTEFGTVWQALEADDGVRAIVVSGAGDRSFCSGADLEEMRGKDYRHALDLESARLFDRVAASPKVSLAAINGAAIAGGLELALACDLRLAAEQASFSFPEPLHGLIPAAGGTERLPQVVGVARAKEMILGGRDWSASEALRHGLVSEVLSLDELSGRAQQWAETVAQRDPLALRLAKQAMAAGTGTARVAEALLYELKRQKTGDH